MGYIPSCSLFCIKKGNFFSKTKMGHKNMKWVLIFVILLSTCLPLKAQETGPLLMKQELGYTLGGSVLGAGLGVIVWFMDPLNPSVTLKSTVQNGFIAGTALGALFGFYMLQNAIIVPQDTTLPENIDQLLGIEDFNGPIQKSIITDKNRLTYKNIYFKFFEFRF